MSGFTQSERKALADLLLTLGPDAPTLCTGWSTRDLAAHLVVRERRPDAAAGLVVPPLRGYGERVRERAATSAYPDLVAQVRQPPWWSPINNPVADSMINTLEFFVHHEDVRRAQPDWQPRSLPAEQQAALWRRVLGIARLALRRFPATVLVKAPGHGEGQVGAGGPQVRLIGAPGELVLFLYGRQQAARIQVAGPPELASKLRSARLGI